MTEPAAEGSPDALICPYLGVARAGDSSALTPRPEQCCFSLADPVAVSPQHQVIFCLTERHPECSRYRPLAARRPASAQPSRHAILSLSGIAVLLAIGAATALSVVVIGNPLSVEPDNSASPTPAVAFAGSPTPAPAEPSASPLTATPIPAATTPNAVMAMSPPATPRPATASATVTPAGRAAPAVTALAAVLSYTVQPGDTLIGLARRFDLSVPVLAAANGLGTADGLRIGQTLRIPDAASPAPTPAAH